MSKLSPLLAFVTTYALLYAAFGMQSPFVPALLRERGLQAQDIGFVLAGRDDRPGDRRTVVAHAADTGAGNWPEQVYGARGAGIIRWTVAAFTTSPGLLACIQPLHGLTFALGEKSTRVRFAIRGFSGHCRWAAED